MKIRYSEIFNSFQGEAGFAGTPTVWLRTFGCNLECNGFGQKDPTDPSSYVLPYQTVELKNFTKLEDLPVFEYGCDSSYSWSNRYKHLVHTDSIEEVAEKLWQHAMLLNVEESTFWNSGWRHKDTKQTIQLCFTGGEPGLWDKQLAEVVQVLVMKDRTPSLITVETNGTKEFPYLVEVCNKWHVALKFSISPKLFSVSGEKNGVNLAILDRLILENHGWLKFVVDGSKRCWEELELTLSSLKSLDYLLWDVWIMPVGATKEQQERPTIAQIANEGMKRGYKIATRNHTYVYGNVIGS